MTKTWVNMRNDFLQSQLYASVNSPAIEKVPELFGIAPSAEPRFKVIDNYQYFTKQIAEALDAAIASSSPIELARKLRAGWDVDEEPLLAFSQELKHKEYERLSLSEKMDLLKEWQEHNTRAFRYHPASIIVADVLYGMLEELLVATIGERARELCSDLVFSLRPVRVHIQMADVTIRQLSEKIRENPDLTDVLLHGKADEIPMRLAELPEFVEFIERYGHLGEIDPCYPKWEEAADYVINAMRHHVMFPQSEPPPQASECEQERQRMLEKINGMLSPEQQAQFSKLFSVVEEFIPLRENQHFLMLKAISGMRHLCLAIGSDLEHSGKLFSRDDVFYLDLEELNVLVLQTEKGDWQLLATSAQERKQAFLCNEQAEPRPVVIEDAVVQPEAEPAPADFSVIKGLAASPGVAVGDARIVRRWSSEYPKVQKGDVVVTPYAAQELALLMDKAVAIVSDVGGRCCHAATEARSRGIPAVLGTTNASNLLKDGQRVRVDGNKGLVQIL